MAAAAPADQPPAPELPNTPLLPAELHETISGFDRETSAAVVGRAAAALRNRHRDSTGPGAVKFLELAVDLEASAAAPSPRDLAVAALMMTGSRMANLITIGADRARRAGSGSIELALIYALSQALFDSAVDQFAARGATEDRRVMMKFNEAIQTAAAQGRWPHTPLLAGAVVMLYQHP
jgi:hypothetical protein